MRKSPAERDQHDQREPGQRQAERDPEARDHARLTFRPWAVARRTSRRVSDARRWPCEQSCSLAIDLVKHALVGEVLLLCRAPAAEHLVDGEEIHVRELLLVLFRRRPDRADGNSAGRDLLAFLAVEEFEIGLGRGARVLPSTTLSTTATGGSARIETDGMTISNLSLPSSLIARKASFSQEMKTSPTPRSTNVMVEPRAPVSSTGTLA